MKKINAHSKSYFASPQRTSEEDLRKEVELVSHNPVVDQLLYATSGILAVLDDNRQIISVNEALLSLLGLGDAADLIGLRPGEAIHCVHAHESPSGCGTTKACASCGAAIAILSAMATGKPVEKICVAATLHHGQKKDLYFHARAVSFSLGEERFILLFLRDMTREQNFAILERAFFHDISNTVMALSGSVQVYERNSVNGQEKFKDRVKTISERLLRELEIQKLFVSGKHFQCHLKKILLPDFIRDLGSLIETHDASKNKKLLWPHLNHYSSLMLCSDEHLLFRILTNMILNALEASGPGDEVKLDFSVQDGFYVFAVHNRAVIDNAIASRIFQRNFSTKADSGRGLGTYSMKLFAENYLNGQVDFISTPQEGTIFYLRLPVKE